MPKILVADDNTNIQKMVTLAFEERGIQVIPVGNGEAAVRRIPDLKPDLVLADIFMPVRNGYEVCEFVKKDERFSHVPVILLVGAFDPLDEKEARRVGADGVLKKPFVPPDPLIAMVTSALEKNPKVAAEMARAKEAAVAPPPPEIPELTPPAMAAPKPLPEFPEPTAEEAAAIYGFGKGVRSLGDDISADAADEPKAPASQDEAGDDEFDSAATSRDWRRNAMDFEIPADAANKPAFAADESLETSMFPSERDVPPRHVRVPEPVEEVPAMQEAAPEHVEEPASGQSFFEAPPAESTPESSSFFQEAEPAAPEVSHVEPEPQPSVSSSETHWMDSVSPSETPYPAGGWMTALTEQQPDVKPVEDSAPAPFSPPVPAEAPEDVQASHPTAQEPEAAQGDSFFADEAGREPATSITPAWEAPREEASDFFESASQGSDPALENEQVGPTGSMRDPMLVEPPAVHVTPEPLLLEEEEAAPSSYDVRPEEVSPLHSFIAPTTSEPAAEERAEESASESAESQTPSLESPSDSIDERIPTGPPPNREALAEIPFLRPPADFHTAAPPAAEANNNAVDAVVQKVLEKLEPQLHDLLSQGVLKPLVENLLQSELTKKEK